MKWGNLVDTLDVDDRRTFGRRADNDYVLQLLDRTIPRVAGEIYCESGNWWVHNCGSRILRLIDDRGLEAFLDPGERKAVAHGRLVVLIAGGVLDYRIELLPPGTARPVEADADRDSATVDVERVPLAPKERVALVALAARSFLDPPRFEADLATAAEAAARTAGPLSLSARAVEKRVQSVKEKFAALPAPREFGSTRELVEHARRVGMITRADLEVLRPDWNTPPRTPPNGS